jgi:cation:H+ antiporter
MQAVPALSLEQLPVWANLLIVAATTVAIGKSAYWIVESATRTARWFRVSQLVIGLTVVAVGTSAPEFAVTILAAFEGRGNISVGNIVGSNIFNLGFILGGAALVRAIPTSPPLLWRDGSVLLATTLLLLALVGIDLRLDRGDGILLFSLLLLYLGYLFVHRKVIPRSEGKLSRLTSFDEAPGTVLRDVRVLVMALVLIVISAHLLINAASAAAKGFGLSEWVIGITIVAAGTSAPEFATVLVGVLKGRYGLSAGTVIGSDIYNLLGVLGLAGILHPVGVDAIARTSLGALSAMVFIVFLFMWSGWRLSRSEGFILLAIALMRWSLALATHGA